jgi:putative ABC transport system permease protein
VRENEPVNIDPTWQLALALVLLVILSVLASLWGRLHIERPIVVASVRAAAQLAAVSGIIVLAIGHLWSSILFVLAMYAIAVWTTTGRVESRNVLHWSALAVLAGVGPVLLVIFATRTAPFNGYALIPIGSIIIGNMMTAHTLNGRRQFAELRANLATYEAALSIGLTRSEAIDLTTQHIAAEALVPNMDATRTVGLVTLPGAFIGVLLGGGGPVRAGASQLLVLIGIMAGQVITVVVMNFLIRSARLLPTDLKERLRP